MEVSMGGFRTTKRATLTPSQCNQLQTGHFSEESPPKADHHAPPPSVQPPRGVDTALFPQEPVRVACPSPAPEPPKDVSPLSVQAILALLSYADVRAAQDYVAQYGLSEEACSTAMTTHNDGFSSQHGITPERGNEGLSPLSLADKQAHDDDDDDNLADAFRHEVEQDIIWGTASALECLQFEPPGSRWHRPRSSPVTTPEPTPSPAPATPTPARRARRVHVQVADAEAPLTAPAPPAPATPTPAEEPPSWCAVDFAWGDKVAESDGAKTFAARERRSGFAVEIKCLSKDALVLNDGLGSLRNEIALQRRVSRTDRHGTAAAHIQQLYAYFWDDARVFLVLEATPSHATPRNLAERLSVPAHAPLREAAAREILHQLLHAVAAVHAQRIVHRRIQPTAIHLTATGDVKLADFSGAIDVRDAARATLPAHCALDYVAPEVLRDGRWTCAADMWSLGVVAWQLLCGAVPEALLSPHRKRSGLAHVEVEFPPHVALDARDLLQGLLNEIPERRLAASAARQHPFFASADNAFTPTRALVLPDSQLSPPSPSPSLRPLILTSILKKNAKRQTDAATPPPSSPVPSVSALSVSRSWQDCCTPPRPRLITSANYARPAAATNSVPASRPSSREHESEELSVSLSTCSFTVSALPPSDGRHTASGTRHDKTDSAVLLRRQLSNSSAGLASSLHANSSWAVSSTTLNVSSLTALTLSCVENTPIEDSASRPRPAQSHSPTSELDSPVPCPVARTQSQVARRKLSYSSGSLDSLGTQGISGSRPQPSSSAGRAEATTSATSLSRAPSLSLASLTAITTAVPMICQAASTYSPPSCYGGMAAAVASNASSSTVNVSSSASHGTDSRTRRHADCAQRLQFDDVSSSTATTASTSSASLPSEPVAGRAGLQQQDPPPWGRPAPLTYKDPYPDRRDEPEPAADVSTDAPQRRARRVVVLSPLTPSGIGEDAGLPSFGGAKDGTRQTATDRLVHVQPSLSFSDSLLVSPVTQPFV